MAKYILSDIFIGDFPITRNYGDNPQNYPMFQIPGHEGVDWGTPDGTPVIAPFDGIILRDAFSGKDYGNYLVIWNPVQCCAVWYCHLLDTPANVGDRVVRGQVVGHTNNTGNSTGPHLHVNFVETDSLGNRLNLDNGKQGFLNINDSNLVEWKLGIPIIPVDDMPPYLKQLFQEKGLDLNNEGQIRDFFQKAIDEEGVKTDLNNANSQIAQDKIDSQNLQLQLKQSWDVNSQQASQLADLSGKLGQCQVDLIAAKSLGRNSVVSGINTTSPFVVKLLSLLKKYFPAKQL